LNAHYYTILPLHYGKCALCRTAPPLVNYFRVNLSTSAFHAGGMLHGWGWFENARIDDDDDEDDDNNIPYELEQELVETNCFRGRAALLPNCAIATAFILCDSVL
jgi:hypothetical protein